jgi:hypothetical protein
MAFWFTIKNRKVIICQEDCPENQEISDILTYVRNNLGSKATDVPPGDVKHVRHGPNKKTYRQGLIFKMS